MILTKKELIEDIYSAIREWDMNPFTKMFARELAKCIMEHNKEKRLDTRK